MSSEDDKYGIHAIDEVIHGKVRLAAMAFISGAGEADFTAIKTAIKASDGNLSVHLRKLEDAGYLVVTKQFSDRRPQTIYALSEDGIRAWQAYLQQMTALLAES